MVEDPWKFDTAVALDFESHARQHIPGYDRVIDKSVAICREFLGSNDRIIDVGCATGETLRRLASAGFVDIIGVDSSADMLEKCLAPGAKLICSEQLPTDHYSAVICNWTLHFMQDKIGYLRSIRQNLEPGGVFILSEKISLDNTQTRLYHSFKKSQGVSPHDIRVKAQRLKDMMHISSMDWYLRTLRDLDFKDIAIIDADFCFCSFMALA